MSAWGNKVKHLDLPHLKLDKIWLKIPRLHPGTSKHLLILLLHSHSVNMLTGSFDQTTILFFTIQ